MVSRLEPVAFHLWRAVGLVSSGALRFWLSLHVCACVYRPGVTSMPQQRQHQTCKVPKERAGSALFATRQWRCDWSAPRACLVSNASTQGTQGTSALVNTEKQQRGDNWDHRLLARAKRENIRCCQALRRAKRAWK